MRSAFKHQRNRLGEGRADIGKKTWKLKGLESLGIESLGNAFTQPGPFGSGLSLEVNIYFRRFVCPCISQSVPLSKFGW